MKIKANGSTHLFDVRQSTCAAGHCHLDHRPGLIVFVAILLLTAAGAVRADDDAVYLAGTFNNWATQSADWQMDRVDDSTFKLGRFWRAGVYEFKFVFNGSWDRHLGAADGNHLQMPGRDVELRVDGSGYYVITLDAKRRSWAFDRATPREPIPVLDIQRESLDTYLLDASHSPCPPTNDNRKPEFRFAAIRLSGGDAGGDIASARDDVTLEPLGNSRARLTIRREGDYRISTAIRYGPNAAVRSSTDHHFGDGFVLRVASTPPKEKLLYPIDAHRWGIPVVVSAITSPMSLNALSPASAVPVTIPEDIHADRVLIVTDERTGKVEYKSEGWHEFIFNPKKGLNLPDDTPIESVALIGDFNGWRADANPMRLDSNNRYRTILELPEGVHHYKFVVNGTIYVEDAAGDKRFRVSDGNGGFNSGLLIGDDAATFGGSKPGEINTMALKHDPTNDRYLSLIASDVARFTVRTLADDVKSVDLTVIGLDDSIQLRKSETAFGFDYWTVHAGIPSGAGTIQYRFWLVAAGDAPEDADKSTEKVHLDAGGAYSWLMHVRFHEFKAVIPGTLEAPDWAKRATWYQIFPERFRNGDKSNDPPRTVPWTQKWDAPYKPGTDVVKGSPQDFEEKGTFFQYIFDRRYGGDLQGVREKLPYLRDLGVTAIYFNPVFQAESLHKYDASDYRHIDDRFGVAGSIKKLKGETTDPATWQWSDSDKVFLDFLDEAHRMGFKVIIDGVFNHTGRDFWAFQDVLKNGKNSEFADWFEIKSWKPFHYEAWDKEDGSLPKLKHDEALGLAKPIREHLFAVTRRWMDPNGDGDPSDGIDGWRLDVASDINANFWRDWRKVVKETNPDAYIVAELWQRSQEWLDGRTFDAVMNYPFARRTLRFVINNKKASTASKFRDEIAEMYGWYRPQVNYVLQNLYDSHDTDRVASMCMNPDVEYDEANRVQDNGPNYNTSKPTPDAYLKLKLLATIQMTFLGAPMVYYGDEVGMYGADDPSDRKPMLWPDLLPYEDPEERIESDVLEHYRRMIAIRNSHPALQLGDYEPVLADDAKAIFAFTRTLGDESILVVLNSSDGQHRLDVPVRWPDGADVVQLDDPEQCELVAPDDGMPASRSCVRPKAKRPASNLKVEAGRLHGKMLAPRTGAIFTVVHETKTP
ncbi:MAG: alpha-glucosidase C-terminal domain-containing protein [Phycisphaerales bacterium]|nr:alpha-glucosidase C-terminal domain-containing protein [Phycisphaerales bacterium]MCB9855589.1 alpha-glucosidase C-terminal domain-containing protein [Phycisphaerales bacterium]MCB9864922.1 alpha-glucosidase C-terminal domain-containing protein [Phycisphaerales bacterium]